MERRELPEERTMPLAPAPCPSREALQHLNGPEITVVVPVRNALGYLRQTVPTVIAAGRRHGRVELIYVDNASSDGSYEYLSSLSPSTIRVVRSSAPTIAGVRNFGVAQGSGRFVSFLDSDCAVCESYFSDALEALHASKAAATGAQYAIPQPPHWIERAWHAMHYIDRERDVVYLNSGNLFVRRDAFLAVGGFREQLVTGEDADFGQRLNEAGYRIHASSKVQAVHLGNPKSVHQFYRRAVWHGLGMFGTTDLHHVDKPVAMLSLHAAATIAGGAFILARPSVTTILGALVLQLIVPGLTIGYRAFEVRRVPPMLSGLTLYWLYWCARIQALLIIACGRASAYRK